MPPCSPWAAPATRSTPRSSPAGWPAAAGSWSTPTPATAPDVIVVNTCGFVEQAKKDSIDTLLAASDAAARRGAKVVAVGCLAERYGAELAESLPEADAVLGFDAYPELAERLGDVLGGHAPAPHVPVDRRTLLPISPVERPGRRRATSPSRATPGCRTWRAPGCPTAPVAPLKLASGCDRRCAFCAIPSFRGSFVSRPPDDVVAEAAWLGMHGVRELVLVSENSTSYGKDLPGGTRGARAAAAAARPRAGHRPRPACRYLQPAEMRPDLLEVIATTPGRRALLRPVVPAREPGGAAPDAPVRLAAGLPRPVRADPRARPRGRASAAT